MRPPDGDVSPRWFKVCKKRSKKATMWTEAQEVLHLTAVFTVNEEKITITVAAVSSIPNAPRRAEERRTCQTTGSQ